MPAYFVDESGGNTASIPCYSKAEMVQRLEEGYGLKLPVTWSATDLALALFYTRAADRWEDDKVGLPFEVDGVMYSLEKVETVAIYGQGKQPKPKSIRVCFFLKGDGDLEGWSYPVDETCLTEAYQIFKGPLGLTLRETDDA
ncbi:MAG: hypothetical protein AAGF24_09045 [Cyanobacteria bacterium P01_H01_bin.121]